MVTLEKHKNHFIIYRDQHPIGSVASYHNPYHMGNCYLKLDLSCYPEEISREIFSQITQEVNSPLQVMIPSRELEQIAFLQAGGFSCKRKCYEAETVMSDLTIPSKESEVLLCQCVRGSKEYAQCCKLIYDSYIQNHVAINPWSAGFDIFCEKLPDHVLYAEQNGKISELAFVEGKEIAYVYGNKSDRFHSFATSLVFQLFKQYETICFESDNCDWASMALRALFANQSEESYDTYVLELT